MLERMQGQKHRSQEGGPCTGPACHHGSWGRAGGPGGGGGSPTLDTSGGLRWTLREQQGMTPGLARSSSGNRPGRCKGVWRGEQGGLCQGFQTQEGKGRGCGAEGNLLGWHRDHPCREGMISSAGGGLLCAWQQLGVKRQSRICTSDC